MKPDQASTASNMTAQHPANGLLTAEPHIVPSDVQVQASSAPRYAISANASFQPRATCTLKHGDTFAVFDHRGDIGGGGGSSEGLYHADTRILSQLELLLEGHRPMLLSSMTQEDNAIFSADLTNPDLLLGDTVALRREQIHVNRLKFVWEGAIFERVLVRNFSDTTRTVHLAFGFSSDFADLFEVRGEKRLRRGTASKVRQSETQVELRYEGLDDIKRITHVEFCPPPTQLDTQTAAYEFRLAPNEGKRLFLRIGRAAASTEDEGWGGQAFYHNLRAARRALRASSGQAVAIQSSNLLFNEVIRRSVSDLYMLVTDTPEGPYPYAGTPWYSTPFGRDGLITALMTLWLDPRLAKGVLKFLAVTQATEIDPSRDAEPGKILHEMRDGEMANLREVPFARYYGSVDSTPLFVLLLGEYYKRTGDLQTVSELWPNVEAALRWIDEYGDRDGDGFVEYARMGDDGLVNQGWKDSMDSIFHFNGKDAEPPIALCEVQAYVYGAKHLAGEMAEVLGHTLQARQLRDQAEALRLRFEAEFWCEEIGTYAIALDGAKQPCRIVSSNAGQVLLTGIASPERAAQVAVTLSDPSSFSGWGIRTLAVSQPRYNPMSYHNGSVWPHDNALIALGLARYGLKDAVAKVFNGLFQAATRMDLRRLPELFCGFPRRLRNSPTLYPVACAPQAWASATTMALLQASLGLELDEAGGQIVFNQPLLPAFLDDLDLRRLRLGNGSADVRLHRDGKDVAVTVTRREGDVRVIVKH
jgi:glycogen debranching enzyme